MGRNRLGIDIFVVVTALGIAYLGFQLLRHRPEAVAKKWAVWVVLGALAIAELLSPLVGASFGTAFGSAAILIFLSVYGLKWGLWKQCPSCGNLVVSQHGTPARFCSNCGTRVESAPEKEKSPPPDLLE